MADANPQDFGKRLRRIDRRHRKMAQGYVTTINPDGLIVARPRRGPRFPWKGLMLTAALLLLFKGFLYMSLGGITYDSRVAKLSEGTFIEKAGAFVMQADPVTLFVSSQINSLVK